MDSRRENIRDFIPEGTPIRQINPNDMDLNDPNVKNFWNQVQFLSKFPEFEEPEVTLEKLGEDEMFAYSKFYDKKKNDFTTIKAYKYDDDPERNMRKVESIKKEDDTLKKIENIRKNNYRLEYFFLRYEGVFRNPNDYKAILIKTGPWINTIENILLYGKTYSASELLFFLSQMIERLSVLEDYGIAHRDINPKNILLTDNPFQEKSTYSYTLRNFSLCCDFPTGKAGSKTLSNSIKGFTKPYVAPEVLKMAGESKVSEYDPFIADVYCLGVVVLRMMDPSLEEHNLSAELIKNNEKFKDQEELLEILEGMLQENPETRWNYKKIITYFKNNEEKIKEKIQAPKDELLFHSKWFIEKVEKAILQEKNSLEGLFREYKRLYEAYNELSRSNEAKFYLDQAWRTFEKLSQEEKNEESFSFVEREIFFLNSFGDWHLKIGELALAEEKLNKAVQKCKEFEDKVKVNYKPFEQKETIKKLEGRALRLSGNLQLEKGSLNEAKEFFERSLKCFQDFFGESHAEVGTANNKLAIAYYNLGDYPMAEKLYFKALRIRNSVLGENHFDVAGSFNNIGQLYFQLGKLSECEEYYNKSLKIFQTLYGENHTNVAICYNNLGLLFEKKGDATKAEEYFLKSLVIRQHLFRNEDHSEVATLYNNLGILYDNRGYPQQAEEFYKKSLNILIRIYGENSCYVADLYNNIGVLENNMGNLEKAEELYLKGYKIRETVFGENHFDVSTSLNNLGSLSFDRGDLKKAEELHLKALKIRQKVLGEKHLETADSFGKLSHVYEAMGKKEEAIEFGEKAHQIAVGLLGQNDPQTIVYHNQVMKITK